MDLIISNLWLILSGLDNEKRPCGHARGSAETEVGGPCTVDKNIQKINLPPHIQNSESQNAKALVPDERFLRF